MINGIKMYFTMAFVIMALVALYFYFWIRGVFSGEDFNLDEYDDYYLSQHDF